MPVTFGEVRIRTHERILDDRPSCAYAGLALGWGHNKESICCNLDDFEMEKEFNKIYPSEEESTTSASLSTTSNTSSSAPKKCTPCERLQVLNDYGYSMVDVIKLEKEKKKALEQRRQLAKEIRGAAKNKSRSSTRSRSPVRNVLSSIKRSLSPKKMNY